ncbi:hypothetical protein ACQ4PT_063070 [Festuca glaucescens]
MDVVLFALLLFMLINASSMFEFHMCQDHVVEPPSARTQPQPQPSVSYLSKLLGTTTFKDNATSSSSPQAVAETQPPKPTIYVKKPPGWYFSIYIRIDRSGSFHTYPHLGGPFKSLQEVKKAIERYLDDKRHKTLWKEQSGDSGMEIVIKKALYWPDGRTRRCSDNQDDAYEFKDILHFQSVGEGNMWYKHFNFTTKTKDGIEDLFFAEVKEERDNELAANTFCKIESNENGHCYGCINNGSIDMKHPDKADAYSGGHLDVAAEEARVRYIYGVQ